MRVIVPVAIVIGGAATLQAHEAGGPVAGASAWDAAALGTLLLAGALYAVGSWRLAQRGAYVRRLEPMCFWSGWAVMMLALAPPMDTAASLTFSMHMAQHELLMLVGAPLMVVGRPILPWLWALPGRTRTLTGARLQQPALSGLWRWATTPVVAWAIHGLVVWIWHAPRFYEVAVRSEAVHAFQHATFVGSAVLFWWGLVYGRYGRAAYGASVLYVFTTMVHTGVLGAAFALSTTPFYAIYEDRAATAGVNPVIDQQLAGLYMWIPAGVVLMICGLALLVAWLAEAERRVKHL